MVNIGESAFEGTALVSNYRLYNREYLWVTYWSYLDNNPNIIIPMNYFRIVNNSNPQVAQTIGKNAFKGTKLESVQIDSNGSPLIINTTAFNNCADLVYADLFGSPLLLNDAVAGNGTRKFGLLFQKGKQGSLKTLNIKDTGSLINPLIEGMFENVDTQVIRYKYNNNRIVSVDIIPVGIFKTANIILCPLIPDNVVTISQDAFNGCTNLQWFSKSDYNSLSEWSPVTSYGIAPNEEVFNYYTFSRTLNLTKIQTIGTRAFLNCSKIQDIIINTTSDISIGDSAFAGCSGLHTISITTTGALTIAANAFTGCSGLTSVTITANNTVGLSDTLSLITSSLNSVSIILKNQTTAISISRNLLNNVVQSININAPFTLTPSSDIAFKSTVTNISLVGSTIPIIIPITFFDSMPNIQSINIAPAAAASYVGTFNSLGSLRSVRIGFSSLLTTFQATTMFNNCPVLTDVRIGGNISANLSAATFVGSNQITTLALNFGDGDMSLGCNLNSLPNLTTLALGGPYTIPDFCFMNNTQLQAVSLFSNISIGVGAFFGCTNILSLSLEEGLVQIKDYAFVNTGVSGEIIIPSTSIIADHMFVGCPNITGITYNCNVHLFHDPTVMQSNFLYALTKESTNVITSLDISGTVTVSANVAADYIPVSVNGTQLNRTTLYSLADKATHNNRHTTLTSLLQSLNHLYESFYILVQYSPCNGEPFDPYHPNKDTLPKPYTPAIVQNFKDALVVIQQASVTVLNLLQSESTTLNFSIPNIISPIQPFVVPTACGFQQAASRIDTRHNYITNTVHNNIWMTNSEKDEAVSQYVIGSSNSNYIIVYTAKNELLDLYNSCNTLYNQLIALNNNIRAVAGSPTTSIPTPYNIPQTQFNLQFATQTIHDITLGSLTDSSGRTIKNDIMSFEMYNGTPCIKWRGANTQFLLTDLDGNNLTVVTLNGTARFNLATVLSANVGAVMVFMYQNAMYTLPTSGITFKFRGALTSIESLAGLYNNTSDISSSSVVLFEDSMTDFRECSVSITSSFLRLESQCFNRWDGNTLTINTDINGLVVGKELFMAATDTTITTNVPLMNFYGTTTVQASAAPTFADLNAIKLTGLIPYLSSMYDVSSGDITDLVIENILVTTSASAGPNGQNNPMFAIKFYDNKKQIERSVIATPYDWFWCALLNQSSALLGGTTFQYATDYYAQGSLGITEPQMNVGTHNYIVIPETFNDKYLGLVNNFAPTTFNYNGKSYTRVQSRTDTSNVKLVAFASTTKEAREKATEQAWIIVMDILGLATIPLMFVGGGTPCLLVEGSLLSEYVGRAALYLSQILRQVSLSITKIRQLETLQSVLFRGFEVIANVGNRISSLSKLTNFTKVINGATKGIGTLADAVDAISCANPLLNTVERATVMQNRLRTGVSTAFREASATRPNSLGMRKFVDSGIADAVSDPYGSAAGKILKSSNRQLFGSSATKVKPSTLTSIKAVEEGDTAVLIFESEGVQGDVVAAASKANSEVTKVVKASFTKVTRGRASGVSRIEKSLPAKQTATTAKGARQSTSFLTKEIRLAMGRRGTLLVSDDVKLLQTAKKAITIRTGGVLSKTGSAKRSLNILVNNTKSTMNRLLGNISNNSSTLRNKVSDALEIISAFSSDTASTISTVQQGIVTSTGTINNSVYSFASTIKAARTAAYNTLVNSMSSLKTTALQIERAAATSVSQVYDGLMSTQSGAKIITSIEDINMAGFNASNNINSILSKSVRTLSSYVESLQDSIIASTPTAIRDEVSWILHNIGHYSPKITIDSAFVVLGMFDLMRPKQDGIYYDTLFRYPTSYSGLSGNLMEIADKIRLEKTYMVVSSANSSIADPISDCNYIITTDIEDAITYANEVDYPTYLPSNSIKNQINKAYSALELGYYVPSTTTYEQTVFQLNSLGQLGVAQSIASPLLLRQNHLWKDIVKMEGGTLADPKSYLFNIWYNSAGNVALPTDAGATRFNDSNILFDTANYMYMAYRPVTYVCTGPSEVTTTAQGSPQPLFNNVFSGSQNTTINYTGTTIPANAFSNGPSDAPGFSMSAINYLNTTTSIGANAFYNCGAATIQTTLSDIDQEAAASAAATAAYKSSSLAPLQVAVTAYNSLSSTASTTAARNEILTKAAIIIRNSTNANNFILAVDNIRSLAGALYNALSAVANTTINAVTSFNTASTELTTAVSNASSIFNQFSSNDTTEFVTQVNTNTSSATKVCTFMLNNAAGSYINTSDWSTYQTSLNSLRNYANIINNNPNIIGLNNAATIASTATSAVNALIAGDAATPAAIAAANAKVISDTALYNSYHATYLAFVANHDAFIANSIRINPQNPNVALAEQEYERQLSRYYKADSDNAAATLDTDTATLTRLTTAAAAAVVANVTIKNLFNTVNRDITVDTTRDITVTIAYGAFAGNPQLRTLTLPDNTTDIGADILAGCDNIQSVTFIGAAPAIVDASLWEALDNAGADILVPPSEQASYTAALGETYTNINLAVDIPNADVTVYIYNLAFVNSLVNNTAPPNIIAVTWTPAGVVPGGTALNTTHLTKNVIDIDDDSIQYTFTRVQSMTGATLPALISESDADDAQFKTGWICTYSANGIIPNF